MGVLQEGSRNIQGLLRPRFRTGTPSFLPRSHGQYSPQHQLQSHMTKVWTQDKEMDTFCHKPIKDHFWPHLYFSLLKVK